MKEIVIIIMVVGIVGAILLAKGISSILDGCFDKNDANKKPKIQFGFALIIVVFEITLLIGVIGIILSQQNKQDKITESYENTDNLHINGNLNTDSTGYYNIRPIKDEPGLYYEINSYLVFRRLSQFSEQPEYVPLTSGGNFYLYDLRSNTVKLNK